MNDYYDEGHVDRTVCFIHGPLSMDMEGHLYCEGCEYENRHEGDEIEFADPGGNSALRAATKDNPRNLP